ncbi:pentapeptide repeat-containing protein [Streptomyces sp. NPDC057543]|uniref:pentapeptide repeat-containing protein n=1 Tax=Streptomyces sp. NPDC057543 TaxID=3346163 RepID=UPI003681813E
MTTLAARPSVPSWPSCGLHDASTDGCRGRIVAPYSRCLAHLDQAKRQAYLGDLQPGSDVDHRGTRLTGALLTALLAAVRDGRRASFGAARFSDADFSDDADFDSAAFEGDADFDRAKFNGAARFHWA